MRTTTKQKPFLMRAAVTLLLAVFMLATAPQTAGAALNVPYIDADGKTQTARNATIVTSGFSDDSSLYVNTDMTLNSVNNYSVSTKNISQNLNKNLPKR